MKRRIPILLLLCLAWTLPAASARAQNPFLQPENAREIGKITFTGNHVTRDYILLREMGIQVGDSYDPVAIADAWERLERLSFIGYVDIQAERPDPQHVDLLILVEEESRFHWMPTWAYERRYDGQIVGLRAGMDNFRGRGEGLQARASWWALQEYSARWSNPGILRSWWLQPELGAYWRRADFHFYPFRLRESGGWAGVSRVFDTGTTLGTEFLYRDLRQDEATDPAQDRAFTSPALSWTIIQDGRDHAGYPHRGLLAQARLAYVNPDNAVDYWMQSYELAAYVPVPWLQILAGRVRYRLTSDSLPLHEREYMGGPMSVRGVDFGCIEGDESFLMNLEIRRPLKMLPLREGKTLGLGVHVFGDWGKAWDHGSGFDSAPIRHAWGAGAHFNFNSFGFRLEWARTDDGENSFVFEDQLMF